MLQEDNMSAEYNIPPCANADEFADYIALGIREVEKATSLRAYNGQIGYFSAKELGTKQAMTFGCDPEMNAWTGVWFQASCDRERVFRTAAGHVHIGDDEIASDYNAQVELGCMMDIVLGLWSVIEDSPEHSRKRRLVYGGAGSMRIKEYGIEYRVLSNFWIFSKELSRQVFHKSIVATELVKNGVTANWFLKEIGITRKDLFEIINNSEVYKADKLYPSVCKVIAQQMPAYELS